MTQLNGVEEKEIILLPMGSIVYWIAFVQTSNNENSDAQVCIFLTKILHRRLFASMFSFDEVHSNCQLIGSIGSYVCATLF